MALKIQHWFFDRLKRPPNIQLSDSLIYDPSPQKFRTNKLPSHRMFIHYRIESTHIEELENLVRNNGQIKNVLKSNNNASVAPISSRVLKETTNNLKVMLPRSKPLVKADRIKSQIGDRKFHFNGNRLISPCNHNRPLHNLNDVPHSASNKSAISQNKQKVFNMVKKETNKEEVQKCLYGRKDSVQSGKKVNVYTKEGMVSPRVPQKKPSFDLPLHKRNVKRGFYSPRQRSEVPTHPLPPQYAAKMDEDQKVEKIKLLDKGLKQNLSLLQEKPEYYEITNSRLFENAETSNEERKQRRKRSDRLKNKQINNSILAKENLINIS